MNAQVRKPLNLEAIVVYGDEPTARVPCAITKLSDDGAYLTVSCGDQLPDDITLWMTPNGRVRRRCTVVSRSLIGVEVRFK